MYSLRELQCLLKLLLLQRLGRLPRFRLRCLMPWQGRGPQPQVSLPAFAARFPLLYGT